MSLQNTFVLGGMVTRCRVTWNLNEQANNVLKEDGPVCFPRVEKEIGAKESVNIGVAAPLAVHRDHSSLCCGLMG